MLERSEALEGSAAAVQHPLTSIPAPRNVAPDPVGPHIPRSGAEQGPQRSMINRQPFAQSLTPAPQAAMQSVPISTSRETKASWRSSVTGIGRVWTGSGTQEGCRAWYRGSGRFHRRFPPHASWSSQTVTQPVSFGPASLTSLTQPNAISSSQEDPAKPAPTANPFPSVQVSGLPSASCRDAHVVPSRRVRGKQPMPELHASSVLDAHAVEASAAEICVNGPLQRQES